MPEDELISQEQTRSVVEFLSAATAKLATPRDLPALAEVLADIVAKLVTVEYLSVYWLDPETGDPQLPVARGFNAEERAEVLRTTMQRHPGRVLRTGETIHVPDVQADPNHTTQETRRSAVVRSRLWMPVKHRDATVGAIGTASARAHTFTEVHVLALGFVCQLAGLVYASIREEQEVRRQLDVVQQQQRELRRRASPILHVGRRVLALPLIGAVDRDRFTQIAEQLLPAIVASRARATIVDLTGADVLHTEAADQLVRLVRAVELLGCECMLSGISPALAAELSQLGAFANASKTFGTLEQALAAIEAK